MVNLSLYPRQVFDARDGSVHRIIVIQDDNTFRTELFGFIRFVSNACNTARNKQQTGQKVTNRYEIRKMLRVKQASFPQKLYLSDLVRSELPEDGRVALPVLETLDFIKEGRNIVLYGNTGTGKTHIATGLGILACEQGYSVLFTSVPLVRITSLYRQKFKYI